MKAKQQLEQAFTALKSSGDYTFVQQGTSKSSYQLILVQTRGKGEYIIITWLSLRIKKGIVQNQVS